MIIPVGQRYIWNWTWEVSASESTLAYNERLERKTKIVELKQRMACIVYQQQTGSAMYERYLKQKITSIISTDFPTQFPDDMTKQLALKLIEYWFFYSCTNVIDPSITFECELNTTKGRIATVLTVASDEDASKKDPILAILASNEKADWIINFNSAPVDSVFGPSGGGNAAHKEFVNSILNLNFWRHVYQDDPASRFPLPSEPHIMLVA